MRGWTLGTHKSGRVKSAFGCSIQHSCLPKGSGGPYVPRIACRYCSGGSEGPWLSNTSCISWRVFVRGSLPVTALSLSLNSLTLSPEWKGYPLNLGFLWDTCSHTHQFSAKLFYKRQVHKFSCRICFWLPQNPLFPYSIFPLRHAPCFQTAKA